MSDLLKKIMHDEIDIPSVPDISLKVLTLLEDEKCSLKKLEDVIFKDQLLTTSILKIANAPLYQTGKTINTLADAILSLGLHNLLAIVSIVSLTQQLSNKHGDALLIKHAMAVCYASSQLSVFVKGVKKEEALVAGLLHDIGKTILAANAPEHYKKAKKLMADEKISGLEAEEEVTGFNHCYVGSALARKWKFPKIYEYVIKHHHDDRVRRASLEDLSYEDKLCYIVRVADKMAHDICVYGWKASEKKTAYLLAVLGIYREDYDEILEKIKEQDSC
ncbi:MAG: HDOD domain-containing protein [Nitrospirae bacterium]|nr:MAG: HDOD domain-containing protein [Nitrospirota bacterium]